MILKKVSLQIKKLKVQLKEKFNGSRRSLTVLPQINYLVGCVSSENKE